MAATTLYLCCLASQPTVPLLHTSTLHHQVSQPVCLPAITNHLVSVQKAVALFYVTHRFLFWHVFQWLLLILDVGKL